MKYLLFLCLFAFGVRSQAQTKVYVCGTSIEYGAGATSVQTDPWPVKFRTLLGSGYSLIFSSRIGATYCNSSNMIPMFKNRVQEASIIILGGPTNDAAYAHMISANATFVQNYQARIDSIRVWNPNARIYCNMATPVKTNSYVLQAYINLRNGQVRQIAQNNGLTVWSADQLPTSILSVDGIHPNTAGYQVMANFFYKEFTREIKEVTPVDINESPSEQTVPVYPGLFLKIAGNKRTLSRDL